jgi:hypothetical protein
MVIATKHRHQTDLLASKRRIAVVIKTTIFPKNTPKNSRRTQAVYGQSMIVTKV